MAKVDMTYIIIPYELCILKTARELNRQRVIFVDAFLTARIQELHFYWTPQRQAEIVII